MLPGMDGFARCFRSAQGQELRAGADADRAGPPRRCARGIRGGSGRLSSEAFRAADISGAAAGLAAAKRVACESGTVTQPKRRRIARPAPMRATRPIKMCSRSTGGRSISATLELRTKDTTIQLTLMEAKLLRHLIRSNGQTVSRKSILEDVWGLREDTDTRAIDNFIVRLRRYHRRRPVQTAASADGARRRISLHGVGSILLRSFRCNHIGTRSGGSR